MLPGSFPISRAITLIAGAWVFLSMRQRRHSGLLGAFVASFVIWAVGSALWSPDPSRALRRSFSYAELWILEWLIFAVCFKRDEYKRLLIACVGGCWVLTIGILWNFLNGNVSGDGRYTATGLDPNDAACTIALGVVIAWYILFKEQDRRSNWGLLRAALWLFLCSSVLSIALTGSRGGVIVLSLGCVFLPLQMWRSRRKARIILTAGLLAAVALISLSRERISLGRLETIKHEADGGDWNGRFAVWHCGMDEVAANPITGVGAGGFSRSVAPCLGTDSAAHSTLLEVTAEHGFIGLALFLGVIATTVWKMRLMQGVDQRFGILLILCWLTAGFALSWENREVTWLVIGVVAAMPRAAQTYWYRLVGWGEILPVIPGVHSSPAIAAPVVSLANRSADEKHSQ